MIKEQRPKANLAVIMQAIALEKEGKQEEAEALERTQIPTPLWMAQVIKEKMGLDFLLALGRNLSGVKAVYGKEWLIK